MPHVIVKLWPGKSEAQKARLAEKITRCESASNIGSDSYLMMVASNGRSRSVRISLK